MQKINPSSPKILQFYTEKTLKTLTGHTNLVTSVAWSPTGNQIASGSLDNTIKIWDVSTGKELKTVASGTSLAIAWKPDGQRLASCSSNATIKIWDSNTGQLLQEYPGQNTGDAQSITWSPDGKLIATCSRVADAIRIWDTITGKELNTLKGLSITWSPDGQRLASGSWNRSIIIWDPRTGQALQTLIKENENDRVFSVAWSPDGQWLASGMAGSGHEDIGIWKHYN